jgi:hypothetical protein
MPGVRPIPDPTEGPVEPRPSDTPLGFEDFSPTPTEQAPVAEPTPEPTPEPEPTETAEPTPEPTGPTPEPQSKSAKT